MERYKKNTVPENFILLGNPSELKTDAEDIISNVKKRCPENFEGNEDFFSFEFRYTDPYDKQFKELKRLQGSAAAAAGRRSEFKGYIIMDLSRWLTHHHEEYLHKTLLFLIDMSDCWKYLFLINDQNKKSAKELTGKVLSVFFHDQIPCGVKESEERTLKGRAAALCKEQGITCGTPVKELLQDLLNQDFSESLVSALLSEMSWKSGKRISMQTLVDVLSEEQTILRYMLTEKEYNRFMNIIEQRKEIWYDEKEAV